MSPDKIKDRAELKVIIARLKKDNKKIVFTNGCFDIIHQGHTTLLQKAKSFGDILIVALNTDGSVKRLKGDARPINKLDIRLKAMAELGQVDFATSFNEDTPLNIIKELKPDILVKGGDWKPEEVVGKTVVETYGGRVETIPYVKGFSTTDIIEKMRNKKNG